MAHRHRHIRHDRAAPVDPRITPGRSLDITANWLHATTAGDTARMVVIRRKFGSLHRVRRIHHYRRERLHHP